MFNLFKKKTAVQKLEETYKKLMKEWHDLSSVNRKLSDEKYAKAQDILTEIDKFKSK